MQIEYHRAQILHRWTARRGTLLIGAVLVDFSLHDETADEEGLRSRLVECVCLNTKPEFTDRFKKRQLKRRALEQVTRYFEGDGERENLFADEAEILTEHGLSLAQEAELTTELREIEREFAMQE